MEKAEFELAFEDYRDFLRFELESLRRDSCAMQGIMNLVDDYNDVINAAPAFFNTVLDALESHIIIWSHKLLEPKRKAKDRGLFHFLDFVEAHLGWFAAPYRDERAKLAFGDAKGGQPTTQSLDSDRAFLRQVAIFESIRIRRNEYHAHFGKITVMNADSILWTELDQTTEAMHDMLNRYSVAYDATQRRWPPSDVNDLRRLRDFAARGLRGC